MPCVSMFFHSNENQAQMMEWHGIDKTPNFDITYRGFQPKSWCAYAYAKQCTYASFVCWTLEEAIKKV